LALFSYKTYSRNKDWQSNLSLFAKGVEDCPNSYRTNTTFAWESILAGEKETDPEKKKNYFQSAVTYYKKGLAIYDKVDADWYNYGVSQSNLNNMDEAVQGYEHALALNPLHRNAGYNLATIYLGRKDFSNSLKYFFMTYRSDSTFLDVPFKIGVNYQLMNDPKNAVTYYEKYFKRNPNNKDVITNLSIAYRSLNDTERSNYYMSLLSRMNAH